jgi:hypothetical protein
MEGRCRVRSKSSWVVLRYDNTWEVRENPYERLKALAFGLFVAVTLEARSWLCRRRQVSMTRRAAKTAYAEMQTDA